MSVRCAVCKSYVCRGGKRDAGPDFCPMKEDFPEFGKLYTDPTDLALLTNAALVEARGYGHWTRLHEVIELAGLLEMSRLGLPHAPDMTWAASRVAGVFRDAGLDPVLPPTSGSPDPLDQVDYLDRKGTEMNVIVGMGVAEESLFLLHTPTPTTCLVARDTRLHHNPAAAIYTSRSYSQKELHGHWPREERPQDPGGEDVLRAMVAEGAGSVPRSRLAEAMEVAHRMGATHLGLSFCVGFKEEAKAVTKILETNGFDVSSACCKTGATPKEDAGVRDDQKIRPGRPEMICNPLAQAELLNRDGVHFAFVLGQCVGHDAAAFRRLECPAICLVAKDRALAHNPVAALA